jgi:hypothetical protein
MVVVPWACRVGVEAAWLGWEEEDERLAAAAASAAWDAADRTAAAVEVERRRQEVHLDVVGRAAPGRAVPEPGEAAAAGSWCTQQYRRETRECFSVPFALSACPDDARVDERGRMSAERESDEGGWLRISRAPRVNVAPRLGQPRALAGWLAGSPRLGLPFARPLARPARVAFIFQLSAPRRREKHIPCEMANIDVC